MAGGVEVGGNPAVTFSGRPLWQFERESDLGVDLIGGVEVGAEYTPTFVSPEPQAISTAGGVQVGGITNPKFIVPVPYRPTVNGGITVGGKTRPVFVGGSTEEEALNTFTWTPYGGVLVGGSTMPVFVLPTAYRHIAEGGVKVSGPTIPDIRFVPPAETGVAIASSRGGVLVGGDTYPTFFTPPVFRHEASQAILAALMVGGGGGAAFIVPQVFVAETDGEIVVGEARDQSVEETFETWAVVGKNNEPSIFSGYNFNSYCIHRDKIYAAGEDGLYVVGGEDDDGNIFRTGVRIGPFNFGLDCDKRIRAVNIGAAGAQTKIRVEVDEEAEGFFGTRKDPRRITVSRDLQGKDFILDIMDFNKLSHLEIIPLVLVRK